VTLTLFNCSTGLQIYFRHEGTNICLRCPLPEGSCLNGDLRGGNLRQRYKRYPPNCLVAWVNWNNFSMKKAEELSKTLLDPDTPSSVNGFRDEVSKFVNN